MAFRFSLPHISQLDANGDPVSGAKANFYESGTTTRLDTYSNEALTSLNANPVVADSAGKWGDIWLQSADYKVIITDSADVVITTMDPVQGNPSVAGDDFKVSQQSPADMTVLVSEGALFDLTTKTRVPKAEQTSTAITAPSADPKIDVIYVDRLSGVIGIAAGAEAASPTVPTIPDGKLPLAEIALAITTTEITDNLITDIRELANIGTGSAAAKNTGAAAGNVPTNDQAFADVASATTTDIGAAASLNVRITGTTTITGLGTVAAGIRRKIRFAAALTLTHNATSLILPGSANISTAANDTAEFISLGSGNWLCLSYKLASGGSLVGAIDLQTFTTDGTYTKPSGATRIRVRATGAGGSGGKNDTGDSGAGGGGGACIEKWFDAADLGATETVTIGLGGAARTTNVAGAAGGNTTFGSLLTAYGGGGGMTSVGGAGSDSGGGGGGGGTGAAGVTATDQNGAAGGAGIISIAGHAGGNGGLGSTAAGPGLDSEWGGGGGGGSQVNLSGTGANFGGSSYNGGGGGGGAATTGTPGPGGSSVSGGDGGDGGVDTTPGGDGIQPGGGGGGSEAGDSGAGGDGQVEVTTWF